MAETIEDLVRADHEKANEKFNELEQMAVTYQRGDKVYCARVEKTSVSIRYGIINRIIYSKKSSEMIFSISPSETESTDFTISSRNWRIFELEQELYDFLHEAIGEESDTPAPENTEPNAEG